MPKSATYTLPWPPTLNHYRMPIVFRKKGGKPTARLITSPEAKEYKLRAGLAIVNQGIVELKGKIKVTEQFYCKTNARYDIDNYRKAIRDILVNMQIIEDDYLIFQDEGIKMPKDPENPRVEITITQIEGNQ